jgi:hypothetical protein
LELKTAIFIANSSSSLSESSRRNERKRHTTSCELDRSKRE